MAEVLRSYCTPTSEVELGQRPYSQLNAFAGRLQEEVRVKIFRVKNILGLTSCTRILHEKLVTSLVSSGVIAKWTHLSQHRLFL